MEMEINVETRELLRDLNENITGLKTEIIAMREDFIRLETRIGTSGSGGLVDDLSRLEHRFEENINRLEGEVEKLKTQMDDIRQKTSKWAGGLALLVFLSGFIGLVVALFSK